MRVVCSSSIAPRESGPSCSREPLPGHEHAEERANTRSRKRGQCRASSDYCQPLWRSRLSRASGGYCVSRSSSRIFATQPLDSRSRPLLLPRPGHHPGTRCLNYTSSYPARSSSRKELCYSATDRCSRCGKSGTQVPHDRFCSPLQCTISPLWS